MILENCNKRSFDLDLDVLSSRWPISKFRNHTNACRILRSNITSKIVSVQYRRPNLDKLRYRDFNFFIVGNVQSSIQHFESIPQQQTLSYRKSPVNWYGTSFVFVCYQLHPVGFPIALRQPFILHAKWE